MCSVLGNTVEKTRAVSYLCIRSCRADLLKALVLLPGHLDSVLPFNLSYKTQLSNHTWLMRCWGLSSITLRKLVRSIPSGCYPSVGIVGHLQGTAKCLAYSKYQGRECVSRLWETKWLHTHALTGSQGGWRGDMGGKTFHPEELRREMPRISVQLEPRAVSMGWQEPKHILLVLSWSSCKRICSLLT